MIWASRYAIGSIVFIFMHTLLIKMCYFIICSKKGVQKKSEKKTLCIQWRGIHHQQQIRVISYSVSSDLYTFSGSSSLFDTRKKHIDQKKRADESLDIVCKYTGIRQVIFFNSCSVHNHVANERNNIIIIILNVNWRTKSKSNMNGAPIAIIKNRQQNTYSAM